MKINAGVLHGVDQPWQVEEIELGDPRPGEVQVKLAASGLCHSDEHVRTGDTPVESFPFVGGHEGAGVVTKVGEGVHSLVEGDHVVLGFVPACGRCDACATGHSSVCDLAADILTGRSISDRTRRVTVAGEEAVTMCLLGTFAPYVTVHETSAIKIDRDIPLDKAALVGCGVTTGWGSAVYAAEVSAGDVVVVVGTGGVGINAVQGAVGAGARYVVAIDPVDFKRDTAKEFGATHTFASMGEALAPLAELTRGKLADKAILTLGRLDGSHIGEFMALLGKNGIGVLTSVGKTGDTQVTLDMNNLTVAQKQLRGSLFGSANTRVDIPRILDLYRDGHLKLDELVTRTYRLEEINEAYEDMYAGRNIRGLVIYE